MVRVVNVKGLRTPEQRAGIVYVGRGCYGWPGHALANPYKPTVTAADLAGETWPGEARLAAVARCVEQYRAWLLTRPALEADLASLWEECGHGTKALGCWCVDQGPRDCAPLCCHAQILAQMLDERFAR